MIQPPYTVQRTSFNLATHGSNCDNSIILPACLITVIPFYFISFHFKFHRFGMPIPMEYTSLQVGADLGVWLSKTLKVLQGTTINQTWVTVFLRSNTAATINFITRFTAATIRGRPLIQGGVY